MSLCDVVCHVTRVFAAQARSASNQGLFGGCMVYGLWFMVHCLLFMVYGLWFMVYGLRFTVYGLRFMVYGLRFTVYGLWFMVYGLWFMVYGLCFLVSIHDFAAWRSLVSRKKTRRRAFSCR